MSEPSEPNAPAAAGATGGKCPFTSLVGKLAGGWWGGAAAAASSASATGAPAGTCPLGFGARSNSSSSSGSKCPLGFGGGGSSPSDAAAAAPATTTAAAINPDALPAMALAEFRQAAAAAGGVGKGFLVSVKGLVFDVSECAGEMAPLLGHDCSRFFAVGGGGSGGSGGVGEAGAAAAASTDAIDPDGVLDQGLEGLKYEQVVRLERVLEGFVRSFGPPVAALAEGDRRALFGGASMVAPGDVGCQEKGVGEKGWRLHELIEQGAGAAVIGELLAGAGETGSALVNCPCPRTGLTPLHKAVESAGEVEEATLMEVVRLLVGKGADLAAPAALYDGDTPVQLARRMRRGPAVEALLQP